MMNIQAFIKSIFIVTGITCLVACQSLVSQQYAINANASYQAVALRTELLLGNWVKDIQDRQPEFSWQVNSEQDKGSQIAYQIQVWRLNPVAKKTLVWDSGKVNTSQAQAVSYKGEALSVETDYQWRVKVWMSDNTGQKQQGIWSQPQKFSTAERFSHQTSVHPLMASPIKAKSIKRLTNGRYLVDFGRSAFGFLELSLTSGSAGVVNIHFAERGTDIGIINKLHRGSSVRYYKVPLPVNAKFDTYRVQPPRDKRNTKANKAIAIPGRFGRIAPFRYVEIETNDIELSNISATQMVVHYPFDPYSSSFESSSEVLNAVWDLSKYSMKATSFAGLYVDGDRERIPYEADAYINQLSHYLVDSEYAMARATHEYLLKHPTWPTEWKQHSIMMAWQDWMYTGDRESLANHYRVLKEDKSFLSLQNELGLLQTFPPTKNRRKPGESRDIVDWPPNERDGYDFKPVNTVVNAFHYLNLQQMADIALVLGKNTDAQMYKQRAEKLHFAFNHNLFNQKTGLYVDGLGSSHSSAHANILPLAVGLVPANKQAKIITFLKSKKMAVSVYFAQYLMEALYQNQQADYALSLLTSTELRSWYNMIRVGSTITLEAWDDQFKPNQDWNHAWGAVPGNIVGRFILGVTPLTAGFEQFVIAPQLGGLQFAKGKVPTIKGAVYVDVEQQSDNKLSITIDIPNNSRAKVVAPILTGKTIKAVLVGGEAIAFDANSGQLGNDLFSPGHYHIEVSYQ
ncbi:alpha-L-rhamnosidase [Saccharobesus litoralis]|uniref:alpha-L-rhamnosidase n=1 Tax=Saccharobesus litoralis TaxID=2172099 RepID=A0A2S0VPQ9_9ALTE|nr:alpha-L-rhamnosidase C-terminal domain-containing protein [Saccharobesus litoralis]AWB66196.1 alpha-L-rhamnosidase [Saccharobesus litoralis]